LCHFYTLCSTIINLLFSFNVNIYILQSKIKRNGERGKESKGGYSWTEDIGEINVSREARILKSKKGGIASLQSNGNDGYQKDKHSTTTLSAKEIRRQRIGKYFKRRSVHRVMEAL